MKELVRDTARCGGELQLLALHKTRARMTLKAVLREPDEAQRADRRACLLGHLDDFLSKPYGP